MEYSEFKKLVKEMREAQISYFRTGDKTILVKSKQLEKKVDAYISNQKTLF